MSFNLCKAVTNDIKIEVTTKDVLSFHIELVDKLCQSLFDVGRYIDNVQHHAIWTFSDTVYSGLMEKVRYALSRFSVILKTCCAYTNSSIMLQTSELK